MSEKTAGLPPAAPHGATDPCGAIGKWPRRRCSAVVKMLASVPSVESKSGAYEQARKVSNPRPSVLETAAPPLARAQVNTRMTGCASTMWMRSERRSVSYQRTSVLPVFPASRSAVCRSSSDRPGRHGYAPMLNGAVPRSSVSTMCTRAMDIDSRHSADDVNRLSANVEYPVAPVTPGGKPAGRTCVSEVVEIPMVVRARERDGELPLALQAPRSLRPPLAGGEHGHRQRDEDHGERSHGRQVTPRAADATPVDQRGADRPQQVRGR